jgi:hypothetical protein
MLLVEVIARVLGQYSQQRLIIRWGNYSLSPRMKEP